jgi:hypothetical protein
MILIEIQWIETANYSEPLKLFGLSPLLLRMHGMSSMGILQTKGSWKGAIVLFYG